MGLTHFPNGISSMGMPVVGGGGNVPATTGNYFFVDSGCGSNANDGLDSDHAVATIDYAVGLCTANNGDIILVMPGHNESITSATSLVVDVAGVSIIGLGQARSRPVLDFDNTAGSIEMDAASTRLSNIVLRASKSATAVAINVDAHDVELDHLEFTYEDTGDDFVIMVDLDAFDRCHIHDCIFATEIGTTSTDHAIRLDDTHDDIIEDCIFKGEFTKCIVNEGAAATHLIMRNCLIYNSDTASYAGIDATTMSTSGILQNIAITSLYANAVAKIMRDGDLTSHNVTGCNALSEANSLNTGIVLTSN